MKESYTRYFGVFIFILIAFLAVSSAYASKGFVERPLKLPTGGFGQLTEIPEEINDTNSALVNATEINIEQEYDFNFSYEGDIDWYKFIPNNETRYIINITNSSSGIDTYLYLYNNDSELLRKNDDRIYGTINDSQIVWYAYENNSYYYIKLTDRYSREGNYSLKITNITATGNEPNDVYQVAENITVGSNYSRVLNPKNDWDFFEFNATNGTRYRIKTNPATTDTYLYLYNTDGTSLLRSNDDENYNGGIYSSYINWECASNGTYYVAVEDAWGNGGASYTYNVSVSVISGNDTNGTDDDYTSANTITVDGSTINSSFSTYLDHDFYKFDAINGTTYVVKTSNLGATGADTKLWVRLQNMTTVTRNDDYQGLFVGYSGGNNGSSRAVFTATNNTTYYVEVVDVWGNYTHNYSIKVEQAGHIEPYFVYPSTDINVTKHGTFDFVAGVRCVGGPCGDIKATLDPKQKYREDKTILSEEEISSKFSDYPGEDVIILLKTPAFRSLQTTAFSTLEAQEFELKRNHTLINAVSGKLSVKGFEKIKDDSSVLAIIPNTKFYAALDESTPLINATDYISQTNTNGTGQVVCVLDTGVDYNHTALGDGLGNVVLGGYDYVDNDEYPMDESTLAGTSGQGHGTHVAGIIASRNDTYQGVAPGSKIAAVRVLDSSGEGTRSDIISGISWCIENSCLYNDSNSECMNISVISMSLGAGEYNSEYSCEYSFPIITNITDIATSYGITVVAASGNNGYSTGIASPACLGSVISVGASTKGDTLASYTNTGSLLDLLAPGSSITSTEYQTTNGFKSMTGTSMATPHVAGAIALLNEYYQQRTGTTLDKAQALSVLGETDTTISGYPRINLVYAYNALSGGHKGVIPEDSGNIFYVDSSVESNPEEGYTYVDVNGNDYNEDTELVVTDDCLYDMADGDNCTVRWVVNATGLNDTTWNFFAEFDQQASIINENYDHRYESLGGLSFNNNQTGEVNITITDANSTPYVSSSSLSENEVIKDSYMINVSALCDTARVTSMEIQWSNATQNSSYFAMSQTNYSHWNYTFYTNSLSDGVYTLTFRANSSIGTSNSSEQVQVIIDNTAPSLIMQSPNSSLSFSDLSFELNYSATDTRLSKVYYILNGGSNTTISDNTTVSVEYPGNQYVKLCANDTAGNINCTATDFYVSGTLNATKWISEKNSSLSNVSSIVLRNSTIDLSNSETVNLNQTLNLTFNLNEFNATILNFNGTLARWDSNFTLLENASGHRQYFEENGTTNIVTSFVLDSVSRNESGSVEEFLGNSTTKNQYYDGFVEYDLNASDYTNIWLCSYPVNRSIYEDCVEITTTGTQYYNSTNTKTKIYVNHFSAIVIENDTIVPTVSINTPNNTTTTNGSDINSITANLSVDSDVTECNYSLNGGSNTSMSSSSSYFVSEIGSPLANGFYNITFYCTDGVNSNVTRNYFRINDTDSPTISFTESSIDDNDGTVTVSSYEPVYGTLFYATSESAAENTVSSSECSSWKDSSTSWASWKDDCSSSDGCDYSIHSFDSISDLSTAIAYSLTGLSDDTRYYYGACICDRQGNCKLEDTNMYFDTEEASSSADDIEGGNEDGENAGGGGSTGTESASTTSTYIWASIQANTKNTMTIGSTAIDVNKIEFYLTSLVDMQTSLSVTSRGTTKPAGLPTPPNNIRQYFSITGYQVKSNLKNARIYFEIPSSWFSSNSYDSQEVQVYHYIDSEWKPVFTKAVSTSGSTYSYYFDTTSFSEFAITAENATVQEINNTEVEVSVESTGIKLNGD